MGKLTLLANKHCIPCQDQVPALMADKIKNLLQQLSSDWQLNPAGHLYKRYRFKNFMQAMTFANQLAALAEEQAHHPDLYLSWGLCAVEIWTHKINGLTENDFILAAKIEVINETMGQA